MKFVYLTTFVKSFIFTNVIKTITIVVIAMIKIVIYIIFEAREKFFIKLTCNFV
jgi:hypothetical protein